MCYTPHRLILLYHSFLLYLCSACAHIYIYIYCMKAPPAPMISVWDKLRIRMQWFKCRTDGEVYKHLRYKTVWLKIVWYIPKLICSRWCYLYRVQSVLQSQLAKQCDFFCNNRWKKNNKMKMGCFNYHRNKPKISIFQWNWDFKIYWFYWITIFVFCWMLQSGSH